MAARKIRETIFHKIVASGGATFELKSKTKNILFSAVLDTGYNNTRPGQLQQAGDSQSGLLKGQ